MVVFVCDAGRPPGIIYGFAVFLSVVLEEVTGAFFCGKSCAGAGQPRQLGIFTFFVKMLYTAGMTVFAALCALGAEKILAHELEHTGFTVLRRQRGRVSFTAASAPQQFAQRRDGRNMSRPEFPSGEAALSALVRANLWLRTADRVYIEAASFPAHNFDALYEGVRRVRWQDIFPKNVRVVVDKVRIYQSKLNSERSVQSISHKAVYDALGAAWRMRTLPETGERREIRIYLERNQVSVLLDTSGEPLYRRGYRHSGGTAPLRETLAAILLHTLSWRRKTPLHDAFCGSGTIPLEAALYACNIAPGLCRPFGFETLPCFLDQAGASLVARLRAEAAAAIRTDCLVRISGSDADPQAVAMAAENARRAFSAAEAEMERAGVSGKIPQPRFSAADFRSLEAPFAEGLLLSNPPYGIRIGSQEEASALYREMAVLRGIFPGWAMGFVSAEKNFEEDFGCRADSVRQFRSGKLDSFFYVYKTKAEY